MLDKLFTHSALRLWLFKEKKWICYNLLTKKKFLLSPSIVATLVIFGNGENINHAYNLLNKYTKNNLEEIDFINLIQKLTTDKLLVSENDPWHIFASHIKNEWSKYNWDEAADYYLATYDYPFITEGKNNTYNSADTGRMSQYLLEETDLNRSKEYKNSLLKTNILSADEALQNLDTPFDKIFSSPTTNKSLNVDSIKIICSIAFGKLRERISTNPRKANITRKISPSGGSRHPTEGYIIIQDNIEELKKGIYHFCLNENSLEKISELPSNIEEMIPGVFRSSFQPKAIFVLTSLFERNMYRYREPRTFRTIFIDIGHVASTIKLTSLALGIKYYAHSYLVEDKVEEILKINKFDEGAIYAIAVA